MQNGRRRATGRASNHTIPTWCACVAAALVGGPAAAQPPSLPAAVAAVAEPAPEGRLDVSVMYGPLAVTDWSDTVVLGSVGPTGVIQEVIVRDLGVEPGTGFDAVVTYWRGRAGFRTHAGYASSCVGSAAACPQASGVDVRTWLVDLGASVLLREPSAGQLWRPYAFAGFGAATYDLSRPIEPEFLTRLGGERLPAARPLVIADGGTQFLLSVDEMNLETSLAFTFGAGADIRIPIGGSALSLRVEVADHVSRSPVDLRLTSFEGTVFGTLPQRQLEFGPVHHFRATAGIVFEFALSSGMGQRPAAGSRPLTYSSGPPGVRTASATITGTP